MLIWLVKIGEILPDKNKNSRLLRTGILGEMLSDFGHNVVWWSSTFDHFKKKQLFAHDTDIKINDRYKIRLIRGCGYKKNVSIERIVDHKIIAKNFKNKIYQETIKPDVIVCSYPTSELAYHCIKYGKKNDIPVIIDIRDLWPDIFFHELFPSSIKYYLLNIFNFFNKKHQYVFKNASALVGITEKILNWGLNYSKRPRHEFDKVYHLSYLKSKITLSSKTIESLKHKGLTFKNDKIYICLIGTISKFKFDLEPVIYAANKLNKIKSNIHFIICGEGEGLEWMKSKTKKLKNINFLGWIDKNEINYILNNVHIGLAPYNNNFTYNTSIPSKISEYLAFGLPIISGLKGELENFIKKHKTGFFYKNREDLYNILFKISKNNTDILNFRNNNISLFKNKFDTKKVYKDYVDYICSFNSQKTIG